MPYAQRTTVPVEKTRAEIEAVLKKYGASQFFTGWEEDVKASIAFKFNDRFVKFILRMPDKGRNATRWEAECRRRWRALLIVIKAKLEAVASEISTFEDEFLAFITLPDGSSVGSWLKPQLALAYKEGKMPTKSLLGISDKSGDKDK